VPPGELFSAPLAFQFDCQRPTCSHVLLVQPPGISTGIFLSTRCRTGGGMRIRGQKVLLTDRACLFHKYPCLELPRQAPPCHASPLFIIAVCGALVLSCPAMPGPAMPRQAMPLFIIAVCGALVLSCHARPRPAAPRLAACLLSPNYLIDLEPAIESVIPGAKPANADEFPGFLKMQTEGILCHRLVKDVI